VFHRDALFSFNHGNDPSDGLAARRILQQCIDGISVFSLTYSVMNRSSRMVFGSRDETRMAALPPHIRHASFPLAAIRSGRYALPFPAIPACRSPSVPIRARGEAEYFHYGSHGFTFRHFFQQRLNGL
jgi:hypothetical protein